ARVARLRAAAIGAQQRAGEEPSGRGLAHAARTREEIRVRDAVRSERVPQRARDRVLSDDRVERLRPPLPGEYLIRHLDLRTSGDPKRPPTPPSRGSAPAEPDALLDDGFSGTLRNIAGRPGNGRAPSSDRHVLRTPHRACSSQVLPRHTGGAPY